MSEDRTRAAGCALLIVFALAEIAAALASGAVAFVIFAAILTQIVPETECDFAGVASLCLAFIAAMPAAFWVDAWCKRVTGHSILDNIPTFP